MDETHCFTLLTGPECEIRPLTGKSAEIYFNQTYIKNGSSLGRLLAHMIARIGSITDIRYNVSKDERERLERNGTRFFDVLDLLSGDIECIALETHKFNFQDLDESPSQIIFSSEYIHKGYEEKMVEGELRVVPVKKSIDWKVDLLQVEQTPYHIPAIDENGQVSYELVQCAEYAEVLQKTSEIKYSVGNDAFLLSLPTLRSQQQALKLFQTASHIAVKFASFCLKRADGTPINTDTMPIKKYNALVKAITNSKWEGKCDLLVELENPWYYDGKPEDENNMRKAAISLMQCQGFLFEAGV